MNRTDLMIATEPVNDSTAWSEGTFVVPEPWVRDALCTQVDPDLFFPAKDTSPTVADAKAVCGACTVTADCLAYALRHHPQEGIWGDSTLTERNDMTRRST